MALNHQIVRYQSKDLGNSEYPFIAITSRSTQTRISSTCKGPIYALNRTILSFTILETIQLCVDK